MRFDNGREEVLLPTLMQSEIAGVGVCYRLQLPLRQAWAITIHKSGWPAVGSTVGSTVEFGCASCQGLHFYDFGYFG